MHVKIAIECNNFSKPWHRSQLFFLSSLLVASTFRSCSEAAGVSFEILLG